ncbi:hypothetical protein BDV93DRAFT_526416 [Ceratobasidium sp. AG-I]|nr:hypothetical protein BDV93DRAFT_526416 [Ceratobasidium sp. AG-I]
MLVIDTNSSRCDAHLTKYVLSQGHVFCQPCIDNVQTSQGAIVHLGVDWQAVINNPHYSANDLPRHAPCPLCRSPFTQHSAQKIQATYSTKSSVFLGEERGNIQSNTSSTTDERNTSHGVDDRFGDTSSSGPSSAQVAIKINLETQVSDIIFEGGGPGSRDEIVALNHQIQEWLADEALEGRIEQHVLLRASIQLLMQSLRSR